jgi:uncharacterized membrane protein YebE (DUF533 family)
MAPAARQERVAAALVRGWARLPNPNHAAALSGRHGVALWEIAMISAQEALVYTMVAAAEADREIADAEIDLIGDLGNHLPIFKGVDRAAMTEMATRCSDLLAQPGDSDRVFTLIRQALRMPLRDTAYALACDVIAVDSRLNRAEMRILENVRTQLEVDPAMARAIERVAEVRFKAA